MKIKLKYIFFLLIPGSFFLVYFSQQIDTDKRSDLSGKSLNRYLVNIRKEYNLPAIGAAVIRMEKIEDAEVIGIRRLGDESKVTLSDCFHIGSNTKSLTAMLAAMIVEDGLLDWETKVIDVFPELKNTIHYSYMMITLKDLLYHRAGIPPYNLVGSFDKIPAFSGTVKQKRKQFVLWQLKQEPKGKTGEYEYSNAGYDIAAAILEEVTKKSWKELIVEKIFKPLKLSSAGFGWPANKNPEQPWGHWQKMNDRTPVEPLPPDHEWKLPDIDAPSGDIHMSIPDFARYVQNHLRGLNGKGNLLLSQTYKTLHKPNGEYAMGWRVEKINTQNCSFHYGSGGTFFAAMLVSHEKNIAVVVATNSGVRSAASACQKVINDLLKHYSN